MSLSKDYFINLINQATKDAMTKEATAPTKGGWDPIFRKRIDSGRLLFKAL